ncbi:MAG: 4Fe-4S binding protein, partial [Pseudobutyrivibrio sp.]|nr:4Fe-4S binding protein [Pseudobutyrivibrio sp.]
CNKASKLYEYTGVEDCNAMAFVPGGGPKACNYGCMGYGSCVKACPFDAIHIVDGVAVVDKEACKACGKCVATCPKQLIEFVPYAAKHVVKCRNFFKGKDVMNVCQVGCIGCKKCEKVCEHDAIHVDGNIAYIDQTKCDDCGECSKNCPRGIIT